MEQEKFKKWMETAKQFQSDHFWNHIFDENQPNSNNQGMNSLPKAGEHFPKCDVYETENELIVEAEIPGLQREDLHVSISQQILTISGEFKTWRPNCRYFVKDRVNRKFKKEIALPYPVLVQKIHTEIKNGVLMIEMPFYRDELEAIPIQFE
jgi:HSP20 family protein